MPAEVEDPAAVPRRLDAPVVAAAARAGRPLQAPGPAGHGRPEGAAASGLSRIPGGRDLAVWLGVVAAGLILTGVAVRLHLPVGTASAPFIGTYRTKLTFGTIAAPAVAVTVVLAVRAGVTARLSWRALLAASFLASAAWTLSLAFVDGGNGLARPMTNPDEYLRDLPAVGGDPVGFVHDFVRHAATFSVATRDHPPAPVLLLWGLARAGVTAPVTLGLLIALVGCLHVPLVAVAVRSLWSEAAARCLLPVLALAPYVVWVAVSMDAVTLTLCAAFVACGVVASERGRRGWSQSGWAAGCGLLLGLAALFGYAVAWLGVSVLAVYFVRRTWLLGPLTAVAALLPLALLRVWGFVWPDGLSAAQADFSVRVEPHRSALVWALLDLVILAVACGPALVPALRSLRRTPGWPFVLGAGTAVGFALAAGLARGEVERSWLPFYPWLLVGSAAVATTTSTREIPARPQVPWPLIATGAAAACVVQAVLRTAW